MEFETDILYSKSHSMDHSLTTYSKRLEQLQKQTDELAAIMRIKDNESIELSSEIQRMRIDKEYARKESAYRR